MNIDLAENPNGIHKSGLLEREVDGEVVVLDTESDRIHQLNASASIVWRMHRQGATAEETARALALEFGVDYASVYIDVGRTLAEFQDLGLVAVDGK